MYWRSQGPAPLPEPIVSRFNGTTAMAITGFEVNVVRVAADGTEVSVPCYESYNHHYGMTIAGADAAVIGLGEEAGQRPVPEVVRPPSAGDLPPGLSAVQNFNEHNGNEARQTYHALPPGVVQAIARPQHFIFSPMQINTRNPADPARPSGGPLPRASRAPPNASYSGLLECPCTTRMKRVPPSAGKPGSINGRPFTADCRPRPLSSLLEDGNPSCAVETYMGGIDCCQDGYLLLDADQEVPPEVDEVHFRWRFYFQDFDPKRHIPSIHLEWALNGCDSGGPRGNPSSCGRIEYDVPQAPPGTPPEQAVHVVTSAWQVRDMLHPCDPVLDAYCADPRSAQDGVLLVMAGGHCHSPGCIDMVLRNADTGEELCTVTARYGTSERAKDERGYGWQPPCQWGSARDGLRPPPLLRLGTNLTSTKRTNSTFGHPGVMAIWQMRAVYRSPASERALGLAAPRRSDIWV